MRTNQNPNIYQKQVRAFANLLESEDGPGNIKKLLVEVHLNYSRQLLAHYDQSGNASPVPFGNPQNQLYCLMRLIALCDAGAQDALLPELVEGNLEAA